MEFIYELEFWVVAVMGSLFFIIYQASALIRDFWGINIKYTGYATIMCIVFMILQYNWIAGLVFICVMIITTIFWFILLNIIKKRRDSKL